AVEGVVFGAARPASVVVTTPNAEYNVRYDGLDTLARDLLPVAQQIVEPLRAFGAYAAALPASSGDEVAALMRYLGRDPNWTA
ncbi:hypothetical protein AB0J52_23215, partial [Spirillospora sp. NPDC049652]